MTRSNPRPRAPQQAGGGRAAIEIAPVLSLVGLVIVGAVSFALLGGTLPSVPGNGGPDGGPVRTPTPSNVVIIDPRANTPGSLLYVKDGNIWVQSGDKAKQLTDGGQDSMPTWAPDGASIYFVRVKPGPGRWVSFGVTHPYNLFIPSLLRIKADGSGKPVVLLTGLVERGNNTWSYFIREPAISPDGTTAAIITDGPDPSTSDIVLKFLDLAGQSLTNPKLGQSQSLGHQDPAWSPDGKTLLYVRNAREGARGTPAIYRYNVTTKKSAALTGPGYTAPSWSRDGKYVVATKTSTFGTDIVILDARTGIEILKVTKDEGSFSPVWSPKGDAVAFFRVVHGVVDLYLVPITGAGADLAAGDPLALTISAGLDAASRPAWFIPADQLPALPTPTPAITAPAGPAGT